MSAHEIMTPESSFRATLGAGEVIHLWLKPVVPTATSQVDVTADVGLKTKLTGAASDDFQRVTYTASDSGEVTFSWDESVTAISLCYAFHPQTVSTEGIRVLRVSERSQGPTERYRLHLAPPFGWMNDPNGLIEKNGVVHTFYQHFPHARQWNNMHWGHAVSNNLIDWVHQPVFLYPTDRMVADASLKGGAFSGSAIALPEEGIRVFHTDREDGRKPMPEWQITAVSTDMISARVGKPILQDRPPIAGFGPDLRDPYVFKGPDGKWKMVLGGADDTAALVLLYETDESDAAGGWTYAGILHRETLPKAVPAECPCVIALDGEGRGLYALGFGLIGHQSLVKGRLNPSFILVGTFDGHAFTELYRREMDFVGDFYAFQPFQHHDGAMGFAWAANWADVKPGRDFASCLSFPRRLLWQDERLLMPPATAVENLRQERLASTADELHHGVTLPDGLAEIVLTARDAGAPFHLQFDHASQPFGIVFDGIAIELTGDWPKAKARGISYRFEIPSVRTLRIILDVGLVEIFVDEGLGCGTKRFDSDLPFTNVTLVSAPKQIETVSVWRLRAKHAPNIQTPPTGGTSTSLKVE